MGDIQPWIPLMAALTSALITGFAAAHVKHRWDAADDARRWERERGERRANQQLECLVDYLAKRPTVSRVADHLEKDGVAAVSATFEQFEISGIRLKLVLPSTIHRREVQADMDRVTAWLEAYGRSGGSRTVDLPAPVEVLQIAVAVQAQ